MQHSLTKPVVDLPLGSFGGGGAIANIRKEVNFFNIAAFGFDLIAELAEGLGEVGFGLFGRSRGDFQATEQEVNKQQHLLQHGVGQEAQTLLDFVLGGLHGG